ncbi:hypothetical protein ACE6ED_24360 [Paenibacillus sp. CN-4]|uniref:hypothetical protein n=1 Tax=Paenibacillus nanchangensis TaxID=3348343 RepID=UPI003978C64D
MKYSVMWTLIIICLSVGLLSGCGTTKEPTWESFEGALNEKSFPVPKEANSPDRATANAALDYVQYSLPGLREKDSIPQPYLDTIKAWGWKEQEADEDNGSRIFEKDDAVVHLAIHDDYFVVMVPKDKKNS